MSNLSSETTRELTVGCINSFQVWTLAKWFYALNSIEQDEIIKVYKEIFFINADNYY